MVSLSLLAPSKGSAMLVLLLALADFSNAAVQCDIITTEHCGKNHRKQNHKLPTHVGSTFYADGFHGGRMYAKLQSMKQSVSGNNQNFDVTYNFNLGGYDGTYWVILPTSSPQQADTCYAVYKNCDVTIPFWQKKDPLPTYYQLA
ncbi:hypothetical protein FOVSG1_015388 [Fusarium oxysporum f. sp. vasinfectum]